MSRSAPSSSATDFTTANMNWEDIEGPDFALCVPPPDMVIPSLSMLHIDHPDLTDSHLVSMLMPCHPWTTHWLQAMATFDSLPHIHVTVLCVDEYSQAMALSRPAALALFLTHMMLYGYPTIRRRHHVHAVVHS